MISVCLPIKGKDLLEILRGAGKDILRISVISWTLIIFPFALIFVLVAKFAPTLIKPAFLLLVLAASIVMGIGILIVRKC
jgi:hypothetical protein